ncbi:IS66 family insertion sequence element accessory protein TnpB [Pseudomonas sp. NPDC098747]|uniref:IS66 family insertion sequence element accessory protein TnpB n=1 Tax=Pseudomonas sp. NPDC098747 TaxID=3364487 RepID=UPI00383AD030
MLRFDEGLKVYPHRDAVDFRKSINGLSALLEQSLGLDLFALAVYLFRNRRADRLKLLGWDRNTQHGFLTATNRMRNCTPLEHPFAFDLTSRLHSF